MASWSQRSRNWIADQRDANPELTGTEFWKHCSKNYPFAMRRGFAYKMFLKELKRACPMPRHFIDLERSQERIPGL